MTNKKLPTEQKMIEQLRSGKIGLPPISFRLIEDQPVIDGKVRLDALIEASWRSRVVKFAVELKSISTPKVFQEAVGFLKSLTLHAGCKPMLFMPFLSEQQLRELEAAGVSGIDMVGNGVIALDEMVVFRTGVKNPFSSSAPIKNIYRRNSSMVARVFLASSVYETVQDICSEVNRRNMLVKYRLKKDMSLSTVSKALNTLVQDLIVDRKDQIRLLQADKLLEKLNANYEPPRIKSRARFRLSTAPDSISQLIFRESRELDLPMVSTGGSSVTRYAVMQKGEMLSVYCPSIDGLMERLDGDESDRFPNLELIETEDETVYFDHREDKGVCWSSPVQCYLELTAGDKRDREAAEQVKSYIMANFQRPFQ